MDKVNHYHDTNSLAISRPNHRGAFCANWYYYMNPLFKLQFYFRHCLFLGFSQKTHWKHSFLLIPKKNINFDGPMCIRLGSIIFLVHMNWWFYKSAGKELSFLCSRLSDLTTRSGNCSLVYRLRAVFIDNLILVKIICSTNIQSFISNDHEYFANNADKVI